MRDPHLRRLQRSQGPDGPFPPSPDQKARHHPGPASLEAAEQRIWGIRSLRIVQRAGDKRHRPSQDLHRKDSLFVLCQSLECLQKLGCLAAHVLRLSISAPVGKATSSPALPLLPPYSYAMMIALLSMSP